jgi:signal peptidase I
MAKDQLHGRWKIVITVWVVASLILVCALSLVVMGAPFQIVQIAGHAMEPTLHDQQRIIVNRLVYRLHDPRSGDVVMMYSPLDPRQSFVKRVIARPGDTVRIRDGRVLVNEAPLDDRYVPNEFRDHGSWGPQVVPEGYYFVMGDRRNNSADSRHWGFVPRKYIVGRFMEGL